MTMNGVVALILRYFTEFASSRSALRKVVEDIPKRSATEMQPKACIFYRYITSGDMMQGTAPSAGLNAKGETKYSDFGPIEGYISEAVQDRR